MVHQEENYVQHSLLGQTVVSSQHDYSPHEICYRTGNLLDDPYAQVLVNPVNCKGIMGAGLAAQFKKRYPNMFQMYQHQCEVGMFTIGHPRLYRESTPWILNFPTKEHYLQLSSLKVIAQGLHYIVEHWQEVGIRSIAFPKLGCGLGGLLWRDVGPLMVLSLTPVIQAGCLVYIYISPGDQEYQQEEEEHKAPYPPPARACYICEKIAWRWDGKQYVCSSGDQAHEERQQE